MGNQCFVPSSQLTVLPWYQNCLAGDASVTQTMGQSTQVFAPLNLTAPVSATCLRVPVAMTTYSTSIASSANATISASIGSTFNALVYTQGSGASTDSLYLASSASAPFIQQWSLSANSAGSQYTITFNVTYPIKGKTTVFTSKLETSLATYSFGTQSLTGFTGSRFIDIPLAGLLASGQYWVGLGMSTGSGGDAVASKLRFAYSNHSVASLGAVVVGSMGAGITQTAGVAADASKRMLQGVGSFTTVGGVTTSALGFSNISSSATHHVPYFQLAMAP